MKARANNLGEAIAQIGHSATLLQQLASVESEIERIDERLAVANQPLDLAFSLESIRDFVTGKALDFKAAFDSEPVKAKEILACHIEGLVLTPRETAGSAVYNVSGDIDLFGGDSKAMSLIADAHSGRSTKNLDGDLSKPQAFDESIVCNDGGGQRRNRSPLHSPNEGAAQRTYRAYTPLQIPIIGLTLQLAT